MEGSHIYYYNRPLLHYITSVLSALGSVLISIVYLEHHKPHTLPPPLWLWLIPMSSRPRTNFLYSMVTGSSDFNLTVPKDWQSFPYIPIETTWRVFSRLTMSSIWQCYLLSVVVCVHTYVHTYVCTCFGNTCMQHAFTDALETESLELSHGCRYLYMGSLWHSHGLNYK